MPDYEGGLGIAPPQAAQLAQSAGTGGATNPWAGTSFDNGFLNLDTLQSLMAQRGGGWALTGADFLSALKPLTGVTLQNPEAWAAADAMKGQPGSDLYTQGAGANLDPSSQRYTDSQGRMFQVTGKDADGNTLIQYVDNGGGGWQNPTGSGHDRVQPTYSLDKNGNATPVDPGTYHKESAWVDWGRPLAALAANMAGTGFGVAALAGAGTGVGGAGVGSALGTGLGYTVPGAGTFAGLSDAELAAVSAGLEGGGGAGAAAAAVGGGGGSAPAYGGVGTPGAGAGTDAIFGPEAAGVGGAGTGGGGSSGLTSMDRAALYGGEGYGPAASPAELAYNGGAGSNFFSQLLSGNFGGLGSAFKTGAQGYGLLQTLSGLYGLTEANKIKKRAQGPGMTKAGLDAVMRSMAAQGYQGSGNMMAAIERYGAETNQGNIPGQAAGLTGQLSSLGLITAGLPALFGWGKGG